MHALSRAGSEANRSGPLFLSEALDSSALARACLLHFFGSGTPDRNSAECGMYYLFFAGIGMLGIILSLFWLKDVLRSPRLARIVYSELVARLALAGAAFSILGLLLIVGDIIGG